jgi:outer membrane protein TolC
MATTRKEEAVLQRMAKIAETLYATGERSQQDVLKAKAEITMLKQRLLELDARENAIQAKLNTLLNRRADAPFGAAVTPPPTNVTLAAEALFALAATNRPEVKAAQAQIERYELESALMARESLPDYRLGLEYRAIANGDNMAMFTVGMDLPVWRSKYRAGVREAEKMKASSQAARAAAERNSALDVQDACFKLSTAQRTLALHRTELIPQAEARFNASESGYQTGKADFMDLLESQRFLLSVRVMSAMAEGDIGMQFARLERAVGADLKSDPERGGNRP